MAHESPLFQSSLELLGHSITHFNGGTELDRKLVILHLANAVELILKDLMLDQGLSIYKNPKETVTLHGAVAALRDGDVELSAFHKVELMIDERNALQHRFGSPNELTTLFYTESAIEFFSGILSTHYGLDLDEVLPQFLPERELAAFRLRKPTNESELENLKKVAAVHPSGALLAAYSYFERVTREFIETVGVGQRIFPRHPAMVTSYRTLERFGVELPDDLRGSLDQVRRLRNAVAHGRREPSRQEVSKAVKAIEELEDLLSELASPARLKETRGIMSAVLAEERRRREKERDVRTREKSAGALSTSVGSAIAGSSVSSGGTGQDSSDTDSEFPGEGGRSA